MDPGRWWDLENKTHLGKESGSSTSTSEKEDFWFKIACSEIDEGSDPLIGMKFEERKENKLNFMIDRRSDEDISWSNILCL